MLRRLSSLSPELLACRQGLPGVASQPALEVLLPPASLPGSRAVDEAAPASSCTPLLQHPQGQPSHAAGSQQPQPPYTQSLPASTAWGRRRTFATSVPEQPSPPRQAPSKPQAGKKPAGAVAATDTSEAEAAHTEGDSRSRQRPLSNDLQFRASRFVRFHQEVLQREMQLKQGDLRAWHHTPKVHAVELTILARGDTRLGQDDVDKADLLLYRLALEHVCGGGGEEVDYVPAEGRKGMTTASGVRVRLKGSAALDFLEKLIYVVLPNQMSFEGLGPAERVRPEGVKLRPHWNPKNAPPDDLYSVKLKVDNLLLYPDFDKNFELFEPLRSMQVDIMVCEAPSADMARLYVSGFGLPLKKEATEE